jgi:propionyl-CoA carboxylase alpha chain
MTRIRKLLVANRGEIALRIMKTARRMGIQTVAVYSDADANAPFVRFADEAVRLGPAPSAESYLRADALLEACRSTGADALHPGYGFLSENAVFCRQVREAGITFVGPSPEAMELMGSKLGAKAAVAAFGVPLVPGMAEPITDVSVARTIALEVGLPVLIKASAGGGGKGMRIVERIEDFEEQMKLAVSEAEKAFGDGAVFIERYVSRPRHIEIQVLADHHGNAVHLFERECSIQRRHQKVVEEAPSSILTPELRERMGQAALQVVKAANYTNAGTVEFILDDQMNFFFLEMNTRLQVEHPVTECITGLDLVEYQLKIAEGQPLPFKQSDLRIHGHAIEIRVYAEDPANNFLPDIGTLEVYSPPQGDGIRVDDGFRQGMEIPIYYDPMLAKLIVHAPDRRQAIEKMKTAIDQYRIVGVETTLDFCWYVLNHEAFQNGDFDTGFVQKYFTPEALQRKLNQEEALALALAHHYWQSRYRQTRPPVVELNPKLSTWQERG